MCRFLFLMKTANSRFDFDLDKVKKQSKENPVFYFQYGHARCASILKKAEEKGSRSWGWRQLTEAQLARLTLPEELAMLKKMSQLPDVVAGAAERLEPHHVLYFCQELITDFHSYYTQYKIGPDHQRRRGEDAGPAGAGGGAEADAEERVRAAGHPRPRVHGGPARGGVSPGRVSIRG